MVHNMKIFTTNTFTVKEAVPMFLEGIGTTLLIAVSSIIIGLILGFGLYVLCANKSKTAKVIMKIYSAIFMDIPVAIILMIFYYLVFGAHPEAGLIASIICFSLTFSASTYVMLDNCISSVEKGQYEACTALGYSKKSRFLKVIFPQTFPQLFPLFKNEAVSHLKATAFVGYIAVSVNDLTHISNIIMGDNTYSVLTILVTAVIYFALISLIALAIKRINIAINPRKRNRKTVLKGVIENDRD